MQEYSKDKAVDKLMIFMGDLGELLKDAKKASSGQYNYWLVTDTAFQKLMNSYLEFNREMMKP